MSAAVTSDPARCGEPAQDRASFYALDLKCRDLSMERCDVFVWGCHVRCVSRELGIDATEVCVCGILPPIPGVSSRTLIYFSFQFPP